MSLTSYRAALPRSLLVCDKADEGIGFAEGCKGYFYFFSFGVAGAFMDRFWGRLGISRNLDLWGGVG